MDTYNSAHGAPQESFAQSPSRANGCRRVTLEMRAHLDQADGFKGLSIGTAKPLTFLFAFQDAEPYLGLPPHAFKLVSWLVGLTNPQDWEEGSRPIASPSAARQREFLGGLSPQRVKMLNRALCEAGIFVMRDHPQGRRFCRRDKGRIIEAYGFDLSLLAVRYDEFVRIAADAKLERERMRKLRRNVTLCRRAVHQAAEELDVQGHSSTDLQRVLQETADLVKAARPCERSEELALVVQALQGRKHEAEQMLRDLIIPVETNPKGQENLPHSTFTSLPANHINDTVIAAKDYSWVEAPPGPKDPGSSNSKHLFPETLHVTPATLVELAPRLAPYMPARTDDKTWPAIVEAALFLSGEMGINRTLWGRACDVMGREYSAVAVAIVSTRPAEHFTSGPGGYFAGMLRKFEKNPQDLCLSRTLWKLKEETWGTEGHKERRELEKIRRRSFGADPVITSASGFMPVGTVLQRQPATPLPPTRPALPALVDSTPASSANSKAWRPSHALLEDARQVGLRIRQQQEHRGEETTSTLAKPENGTANAAPLQDGDED